MRTIYLASASRARKALLRALGIKVRVMVSDAKEAKTARNVSFATLVKRNALTKAKDVASKVKGGIIIGADTIVVEGKTVFGKPKNLLQAQRMLKRLSRHPQWLYTGIAVIDNDARKTVCSYEKTKIFMDPLSDAEIRRYFARVSPLDKAGSFDIQGRGALFIRRIEGCYFNVVGLPLRRLYRMLKQLRVDLLCLSLCALAVIAPLFLTGCMSEYNIATKQEEIYFYSTDREVRMGESIAREVLKDYKLVDDPLVQQRVVDIGQKIVRVCDRKDIDYHFAVLDADEVNAFALPGGFVYVFKGLIDKTSNDDELAAVLAHEVTHIVARHSIKKLQALMGYQILQVLVAASNTSGSGAVASAADVAFVQILTGYARDDELLSDELGARYLKLAGYNPGAMIDFLKKLQEVHRRSPLREQSYFKTHPYVPDRIRVVKQELGEKIDFKDYINIEEKKGLE